VLNLTTRFVSAARAFASAWSDPSVALPYGVGTQTPEGTAERLTRIAVLEALWRNDLHDRHSALGATYRADHALYRFTEGLENPVPQLVEFWATHLMGGALDPMAGDGSDTPSALPLLGIDGPGRAAVAELWAASNWGQAKTRWTRWGAMLGDAVLGLGEDVERQRVRLEPWHPGVLASVTWSDGGDEVVKYIRQERRIDPESGKWVGYRETCSLEGGQTVWRLERSLWGGRWTPYHWGRVDESGNPQAEWSRPLGFVPLWIAQHIDVGADWGMAETELLRVKAHHLDDASSMLHDHIRRACRGAWMVFGSRAPNGNRTGAPDPAIRITGAESADTTLDDRTERDEVATIWIREPDGSVQSLATGVDVGAVSAELRRRLDGLEDTAPELRFERLRTGGAISGEALHVARQPVEAKVRERRPGYDQTLVQAIRGALASGGLQGFPAYRGFGPDDYRGGKLAGLTIGPRPVFEAGELERLATEKARGEAAKALQDGGLPLAVALERAGFDRAAVRAAVAERDANREALLATVEQNRQDGETPPGAEDAEL
jgi:hypothetical protein